MFKNNKIYKVDKKGRKKRVFFIKGLRIIFKGKNSEIIIHEPMLKFKHSKITCENNCKIEIKKSTHYAFRLNILADANNSYCLINQDAHFTNECTLFFYKEENKQIIIGENCMFGRNIFLRTTDSHSIIDTKTNQVLNQGGDIVLGNNIWIGANTTILKNTKIADNCVIATCSVVTKDCNQSNSIYAGVPAKVVKGNIRWDRKAPTEIGANEDGLCLK